MLTYRVIVRSPSKRLLRGFTLVTRMRTPANKWVYTAEPIVTHKLEEACRMHDLYKSQGLDVIIQEAALSRVNARMAP